MAISSDIHTLQHTACVSSREEQNNCTRSLKVLSLYRTSTKWEKTFKNSDNINTSLVWSCCFPVVKCFWRLEAVFWVWWPFRDGPWCVCTHSCVASVQALFYTFKCCSWTKRYLGSAQMFIQLISCVLADTHRHPGTHTHMQQGVTSIRL